VSERALVAGSVQPDLDAVEERIRSLLSGFAEGDRWAALRARYVLPAVGHLFQHQGKLLRPFLVLLGARACGASHPAARAALINTAAAVELIHTASLVHDDMVDASAERRGAPSVHVAHGSTTAILVGDFLYARFFEELAGLPGADAAVRLRLLSVFLRVTRRMCEGEILADQMRQEGTTPTCEAYLFIAEAKTAELLSACCFAGALLGGAAEPAAAALADYGRSLGLLFQIADDLADGDAACEDRAALAGAAEEHRRRTAAALAGFPHGDALDTLRALPERILSPSRA
jgi:octaprenyl-diphosphate synthase